MKRFLTLITLLLSVAAFAQDGLTETPIQRHLFGIELDQTITVNEIESKTGKKCKKSNNIPGTEFIQYYCEGLYFAGLNWQVTTFLLSQNKVCRIIMTTLYSSNIYATYYFNSLSSKYQMKYDDLEKTKDKEYKDFIEENLNCEIYVFEDENTIINLTKTKFGLVSLEYRSKIHDKLNIENSLNEI